MARIEILHVRDPDSSCEMRVWVDGVEADFYVEGVDPGAGHTLDDWNDRIEWVRERRDEHTPEFNDAVVAALESYTDNKYIEDR